MRHCGKFGVLAVLGLCGFAASARADEQKISVDQLPPAVMNAVKAKYPEAKIKEAAKDVEEGKTTYEVSLTDRGQSLDVSFQPNGTIVAIERQIKVSELPAAVTAALKQKYPKAELESAEELTEDGKVTYEVVVELENDKDYEVVLDRSGKILKTEEIKEDEKDEKDEKKKD